MVEISVLCEERTHWKYAIIKLRHKQKDRSDCDSYREMSLLVAHAGELLLKIVASRLSNFCEDTGILHEEQCGFRPARSAVDMLVLIVVRRLQGLGRA